MRSSKVSSCQRWRWGLEGSFPLFSVAVALTASLEKARLEAWGRETPREIRLHLLPSVLSPSESSADFSVEPYLECSMRVRPSASLPVISCCSPTLLLCLALFFFFLSMMCVHLWNQDFLLEWYVLPVPGEENRHEWLFVWPWC